MVNIVPFPTAFGFSEFLFRAVDVRSMSRMEGRATETAVFASRYWSLDSAVTPYLTPEQIDAAETFLETAGQGGNVFLCYDYFRPRPRAYGDAPLSGTRAGGGAFDGTATLQTVVDSKTLLISGLPAAFALNKGCHVEVRKSDTERSLHKIAADVTASGGGSVTVALTHPLPSLFTSANSLVNFEKPSIPMLLNSDAQVTRSWQGRQASFSATEWWPAS